MSERGGRVAKVAAGQQQADGRDALDQRPLRQAAARLPQGVAGQREVTGQPVVAGRKPAAGVFVSAIAPGQKVGLERGPELALRIPPPLRGQEEVVRQDNAFRQASLEMQELEPSGVPGEVEARRGVQRLAQRRRGDRQGAREERKTNQKRAGDKTPPTRC